MDKALLFYKHFEIVGFMGKKKSEFQDESENMSFREFEIGYLFKGVIF